MGKQDQFRVVSAMTARAITGGRSNRPWDHTERPTHARHGNIYFNPVMSHRRQVSFVPTAIKAAVVLLMVGAMTPSQADYVQQVTSNRQVSLLAQARCSGQMNNTVKALNITGFSGQAAGLIGDEIAAYDPTGIALNISFVIQAGGLANSIAAYVLDTQRSSLPSCEQDFLGSVQVLDGGASITGDSIFNNNLGVAQNLLVGGDVSGSHVAATLGISADGGAIRLGDANGSTYSSGITLGGGALSGAGTSGQQATTGDVNAIAIGNGANASTATSTALGTLANAGAINSTAIGAGAQSSGISSTANGQAAKASGAGSTAIGQAAKATAHDATASGQNAIASGLASTANGQAAMASGTNSTAIGQAAQASALGATAIGRAARATDTNTTALGTNAVANYSGSVAIGAGAKALADPTTAVGSNAIANGSNSVALGANTTANGSNSVALGQDSVANRSNSVSVGNSTDGLTRQITNVAPATQGTDAVNLNQLNQTASELRDQINQTGAIASAISQIQLPPGYSHGLGVAIGHQGNKAAFALGYVGTPRPNIEIKFSAGVSGNSASIGSGLTVGW